MPILFHAADVTCPGNPGGISPEQLRAACEGAAQAARTAAEPGLAIEAALGELHDRLDGALVVVLMLEHGRLWLVGTRGYTTIPEGLPTGEGVVGRAVREGTSQLVLDVGADADFIETASGIVSELAVPLVSSEGVVGVVDIETFSRLPDDAGAFATDVAAVLAPVVQELRSGRHLDLSSLARLFVYVSSLRDPASIGDVAVRSLPRVLPVETSQLLLRDESGRLADLSLWRASDEVPEPLSLDALEALRERIDPSAVFELLDADALRVSGIAGGSVRAAVLLPLRASGQELGLLVGTSRFGKEFDRSQADAAALLAAHTAASLDAALALGRERRSALTDPLTGLLNRRGLEERLERELHDAQAERSPLSLIVLDCDDFKDVNDRAGHEFGDALLREIGHVLGSIASDVGCAARLGGDEFVVMLPATEADLAEAAASTCRSG
jgi:GGDEF domain-containing protein